ncbi:MAG: DNA alkylation repair protein [Mediterranea massiliensis]|nr:DNA alkylation repair protein [Mediterranea massiliensis]
MKQIVEEIEQALRQYADPVKQEILPRFFKTGKGEYGEGDCFLGVVVPNVRLVARQCRNIPFEAVAALLQSPWHECRLCALLILVERFKKTDEKEQKRIFNFYLVHTPYINNWDLVDLSAPAIVGEYLKQKPREVLYRLADSSLLWEQRIAIVSTLTFIRNHDFTDTFRLSAHFLHTGCTLNAHSCQPLHTKLHTHFKMHDLMQKAIGWMLREAGKRNKELLLHFLEEHHARMPRTMLRYAIEKFPEPERKYWLKR